MSETDPIPQPAPQPGSQDEGSRAGAGPDVDRPGGGRTGRETAVDEATGAHGEPPR